MRFPFPIRTIRPQIERVQVSGGTSELTSWQNRPLDAVWPVVYIDALWIKIRDGQVVNRPVYVAVGVDLDGCKHILGLWIGKDAGEGSRHWLRVLGELKARGIADLCILCCDGLTGLPEAVNTVWPATTVQTCVIHLMRGSLRLASKRDHAKLVPALRAIYTAPTEQAAQQALDDFATSELGRRYPAIERSWRAAWPEFVPYLAFPPEIRKVIYSTNMIWVLYLRGRSRGSCPDRRGQYGRPARRAAPASAHRRSRWRSAAAYTARSRPPRSQAAPAEQVAADATVPGSRSAATVPGSRSAATA